ncbi:MAG: hypothetical protein IIB88_08240 [Chloroflexi bacterium]|nr:hypothetical protein [Chloroflexota bacterium]
MRKLLLMMVIGIGIVAVLRRVLPAEQRARLQENLSSVSGTVMERGMEMMPEASPPKVMMSTMRRIEEQNDEIARLVRAQNKLLRKRTRS